MHSSAKDHINTVVFSPFIEQREWSEGVNYLVVFLTKFWEAETCLSPE